MQFAGMLILGFVLGWLNVGMLGGAVIFVIAAALALGRP